MPSQLLVYLIEEESIRKKPISCIKGRLKTEPSLLNRSWYFSTSKEFKSCLYEVGSLLIGNNLDTNRLLIISAHGIKQTGTLLKTVSDEPINFCLFTDFFKILTSNLVIYISACWGGYPSIAASIRTSLTNKPTVIGPLVNINSQHNEELQDCIINILKENDVYEPKLCTLISELNIKWNSLYRQPSVGIVTRNGENIPQADICLLAAPLREKENKGIGIPYRIVALQKYDCRNDSDPAYAILWDGDKFWRADLPAIINSDAPSNPYDLIGKFFEITARIVHEPDSDIEIGNLDVIKAFHLEGNSKLKKYRPHSNSNVSEKPDKNKTVAPREMSASSIGRSCKVCNWAKLIWWQRRNEKGERKFGIKGKCFRNHCEEHAGEFCN